MSLKCEELGGVGEIGYDKAVSCFVDVMYIVPEVTTRCMLYPQSLSHAAVLTHAIVACSGVVLQFHGVSDLTRY